jgi:hypothetical protein
MGRRVDLDRLATALRGRYGRSDPPLRIAVTNGGRQLTVVPEGGGRAQMAQGLKGSGRAAPQGDSFELYVALQSSAEAAADARIAPSPGESVTLEIEPGRRSQMWTLPGPGEDRVVIRLRRGEAMTDEAARHLMRAVEEALE